MVVCVLISNIAAEVGLEDPQNAMSPVIVYFVFHALFSPQISLPNIICMDDKPMICVNHNTPKEATLSHIYFFHSHLIRVAKFSARYVSSFPSVKLVKIAGLGNDHAYIKPQRCTL